MIGLWSAIKKKGVTEMIYNDDTCSVYLSVRSLCELALRTGDIGGFNSYDNEPKVDRKELNRALQRGADGFYNTEVSLSGTFNVDGDRKSVV